jgi:hypothetical protein
MSSQAEKDGMPTTMIVVEIGALGVLGGNGTQVLGGSI